MKDANIRKAAKRVRASVKEAIGKVTGDKRIEAEGAAEKLASQTMPAAGEIKNGSGNDLSG
jgi:uncharacterized protein YjbJ (UPF0337 family)